MTPMFSDLTIPWFALLAMGLCIGTFGTLIGAGGGFILMPALVLIYPDENPALLASISLAVVFFNAASGSLGYARQHRIDYRAGAQFALMAVPGAILGAYTTPLLPRQTFDTILGVLLIGASIFIIFSAPKRIKQRDTQALTTPPPVPGEDEGSGDPPGATPSPPRIRYPFKLGLLISFATGFVSSLLGIGGGIIHVPALVLLLGFPVHVATATSHFVLALTALAGTGVHMSEGNFTAGGRRVLFLSIGVMIGAQIGARLARHAPPTLIIRALALALTLVGIRITYGALMHM